MAGLERVLRQTIPDEFFVEAHRIVAGYQPANPDFLEISMEWSCQKIVQSALTLRANLHNARYGKRVNNKLIEDLRREIAAKGGVEAVDAWLKENDTGHSLLSDISGFDTGLLE